MQSICKFFAVFIQVSLSASQNYIKTNIFRYFQNLSLRQIPVSAKIFIVFLMTESGKSHLKYIYFNPKRYIFRAPFISLPIELSHLLQLYILLDPKSSFMFPQNVHILLVYLSFIIP